MAVVSDEGQRRHQTWFLHTTWLYCSQQKPLKRTVCLGLSSVTKWSPKRVLMKPHQSNLLLWSNQLWMRSWKSCESQKLHNEGRETVMFDKCPGMLFRMLIWRRKLLLSENPGENVTSWLKNVFSACFAISGAIPHDFETIGLRHEHQNGSLKRPLQVSVMMTCFNMWPSRYVRMCRLYSHPMGLWQCSTLQVPQGFWFSSSTNFTLIEFCPGALQGENTTVKGVPNSLWSIWNGQQPGENEHTALGQPKSKFNQPLCEPCSEISLTSCYICTPKI